MDWIKLTLNFVQFSGLVFDVRRREVDMLKAVVWVIQVIVPVYCVDSSQLLDGLVLLSSDGQLVDRDKGVHEWRQRYCDY